MSDKINGFFNDDGTPVNPDLMPKPGLCVSCRYDDDPKQENPCVLNRMDQRGEVDFKCGAYEKK
ncbi:MAG: hypothetical protein V1670_05445 [Candidatus Omnitrophota bacterium]|jgi:hypothetical protein